MHGNLFALSCRRENTYFLLPKNILADTHMRAIWGKNFTKVYDFTNICTFGKGNSFGLINVYDDAVAQPVLLFNFNVLIAQSKRRALVCVLLNKLYLPDKRIQEHAHMKKLTSCI